MIIDVALTFSGTNVTLTSSLLFSSVSGATVPTMTGLSIQALKCKER